jgi:7-cyano-7-deazaguanine synthase
VSKALVLFSGGQDSVACLYWAKKNFGSVETITFDYGQRHSIEIEGATRIAQRAEVPQKILRLSELTQLGGNALTDASAALENEGGALNLPTSFVPGRNILFLTLAAAWALQRDARDLVTGVCETDYSGYPDCRGEFIESMEQSLSLGIGTPLKIHTPLMHLNKAQTFALAAELGCLEVVLEDSNTCYNGDRIHRHAWGYGCGECPACRLRRNGFEEWKGTKKNG